MHPERSNVTHGNRKKCDGVAEIVVYERKRTGSPRSETSEGSFCLELTNGVAGTMARKNINEKHFKKSGSEEE